jgi:hypothetical protein
MIEDRPDFSGVLNDRFITGFEQGVENSGGGKRVWGKFIEVLGLNSYERLGNVVPNGKPATLLMRIIPVTGRIYALQGFKFGGDAGDDQEIRQCLATFRFIKPPVVPTGFAFLESKAVRIGFWTGVMVAGIALMAMRRAKAARKRQRDAAMPPPPIHG